MEAAARNKARSSGGRDDIYGPEKALFDKTWTLADVEKVKQ